MGELPIFYEMERNQDTLTFHSCQISEFNWIGP